MAQRVKLANPLPVFGIDKSMPGEYITARGTSDCTNIKVRRNLIEKRAGTELLGASLGERVLYFGELDTGSTTHFYRIGPSKFQELDKTTDIWADRANTPLLGSDSSVISAAYPLLLGERILVYTNGTDAIRKWTGGGNDADLGGTPPTCKLLLYFQTYLILANITNDGAGNVRPWRVQWCDTADPENWSTGNSGSRELLEDSTEITGAGYFGQYFTLHKENAIYVGYPVNTSAVFQFERKETGSGAIAANTILSLPTGEQIFLARDGFRLFNGIQAPLIPSPISDEIREYLNPEHAYKSWAKLVKENDEVWLGVPLGGQETPETVFKFNYISRQAYKDARASVTACGEYKNTQGQISWDELTHTWDAWVGPWDNIYLSTLNPIIVFGTSAGVTTAQYSGSSDLGAAIDGDWKGKSFTSKEFGIESGILMEWNEMVIEAKGSGTLEIEYSTDDGMSWNTAGSIELTSDFPTDTDPHTVYFDVLSERFMPRVRHRANDATFSLKQIYIAATPREEAER